jgi:hypothetical protein
MMQGFQRDLDNSQYNLAYYNQLKRAERNGKYIKKSPSKDFASKEVVVSDYLIIPQKYESIAYISYFIGIPYFMGIIFIFFFIAGAVYENFSLLDLTSFLIIWGIGYEVTGILLLFSIFIAYIKFLKNSFK